jgi:hypothetical protein
MEGALLACPFVLEYPYQVQLVEYRLEDAVEAAGEQQVCPYHDETSTGENRLSLPAMGIRPENPCRTKTAGWQRWVYMSLGNNLADVRGKSHHGRGLDSLVG